jgi:hypothetical protein
MGGMQQRFALLKLGYLKNVSEVRQGGNSLNVYPVTNTN